MTTVGDILRRVETIAPPEMKMEWDNVGLLCGSRTAAVRRCLVALDPFEAVCREAADWGAELVVTHHPLIFQPPRAITDETAVGRGIMLLCRHGISAINAHTNLDCAPGGVNDVLARTLGLEAVEIIPPVSYDSQGAAFGLLRRGTVPEQPLWEFLAQVKARLKAPGLRYVDGGKPVRVVAVGGGACAGELADAAAAGCDTFVTADVKYNQFWDAHDLGINLIDGGHFYTENPVVEILARDLAAHFPQVEVRVSARHWDCMGYF